MMNSNNSSNVYTKDPNMVTRKVAGEMILVPVRNVSEILNIITLNKVGARVWELIDGTLTIEQIRDAITTEYTVKPAQAEADILEFTTGLKQIGALSIIGR
jgi:hypothetical protein